eukprot:1138259-Pleurochrysis_carterae.AAC.1
MDPAHTDGTRTHRWNPHTQMEPAHAARRCDSRNAYRELPFAAQHRSVQLLARFPFTPPHSQFSHDEAHPFLFAPSFGAGTTARGATYRRSSPTSSRRRIRALRRT